MSAARSFVATAALLALTLGGALAGAAGGWLASRWVGGLAPLVIFGAFTGGMLGHDLGGRIVDALPQHTEEPSTLEQVADGALAGLRVALGGAAGALGGMVVGGIIYLMLGLGGAGWRSAALAAVVWAGGLLGATLAGRRISPRPRGALRGAAVAVAVGMSAAGTALSPLSTSLPGAFLAGVGASLLAGVALLRPPPIER